MRYNIISSWQTRNLKKKIDFPEKKKFLPDTTLLGMSRYQYTITDLCIFIRKLWSEKQINFPENQVSDWGMWFLELTVTKKENRKKREMFPITVTFDNL